MATSAPPAPMYGVQPQHPPQPQAAPPPPAPPTTTPYEIPSVPSKLIRGQVWAVGHRQAQYYRIVKILKYKQFLITFTPSLFSKEQVLNCNSILYILA